MDREPRVSEVAEGVWTIAAPLTLVGIEAGTRTMLVRLPDGSLWVHSPCKIDDALEAEVRTLGEVSALVAPNSFHHLYLRSWKRRFPEASLYVSRGLPKKRPDLEGVHVIGAGEEPSWSSTLIPLQVEGFPTAEEVLFFHPASGTLMATDLLMNQQHVDSAVSRLFWRLNGVYGKPGRSVIGRLLCRDSEAARASLRPILDWGIQRITVAHGEIIEDDCVGLLRRSFGV
ncbi:MAG: DUF4336 domain-containing protein [Myxococcales bacterium]|nr:DUF4336 domain-containing protein [Myxococcales bacterium]